MKQIRTESWANNDFTLTVGELIDILKTHDPEVAVYASWEGQIITVTPEHIIKEGPNKWLTEAVIILEVD